MKDSRPPALDYARPNNRPGRPVLAVVIALIAICLSVVGLFALSAVVILSIALVVTRGLELVLATTSILFAGIVAYNFLIIAVRLFRDVGRIANGG